MQRDLRHFDGAFYSAEDVPTATRMTPGPRRGGGLYVWKASEIDELLGKEEGSIFRYAYGAWRDGNARPESDPHEELKGLNTLFRCLFAEEDGRIFQAGGGQGGGASGAGSEGPV